MIDDLPRDRHVALRRHLLTEIRRPARRRWPVVLAPAVTGGLAVALAVTVAVWPAGAPDSLPLLGAGPGATVPEARGGPEAVAFLDRVALVAAAQPATAIREDQWIYIRSRVAWTSQTNSDPKRILDEVHDREIWIPQRTGADGLLIERGERTPIPEMIGNDLLDGYPTDPAALLAKIYADTQGQGQTPDQQAFTTIGDLLRESVPSPELSAALYRAAGRIPGVLLVDDSEDAAGRHGIAVAHVHNGERTEWIFDAQSLSYLGERSYLVESDGTNPAGMLTATTAVTERKIVDAAGIRS